MHFSSLLAPALLAATASSQTLNSWRQRIFPICCDFDENLIDGDPLSYGVLHTNEISLLHNTRETYLGFYIRSSSRYLVDIEVSYHSPFFDHVTVGKAHSTTPGWLAVALHNEDGEPGVRASYFTITIINVGGNATETRINEIYPIYPGDEIVFPPTPSGSPSIPPPTWNPIETQAPTPKAPGLILNRWPIKPTVHGSSSGEAVVDRNPDTTSTQALSPSNSYTLSWYSPKQLKGVYILSSTENFLTGYHIVATDAYSREDVEVCRVTSASSNFTVCAFRAESLVNSNDIVIYPDTLKGDGQTVHINEIWPIFLGEDFIDPETVDVYGQS